VQTPHANEEFVVPVKWLFSQQSCSDLSPRYGLLFYQINQPIASFTLEQQLSQGSFSPVFD
jgi:hypothetical protein